MNQRTYPSSKLEELEFNAFRVYLKKAYAHQGNLLTPLQREKMHEAIQQRLAQYIVANGEPPMWESVFIFDHL